MMMKRLGKLVTDSFLKIVMKLGLIELGLVLTGILLIVAVVIVK